MRQCRETPGIGNNFINETTIKHFKNNKNGYTLLEGNVKQPLGRYITEKIYDDDPTSLRILKEKKLNYIQENDTMSDEEKRIRRHENIKISKTLNKGKI